MAGEPSEGAPDAVKLDAVDLRIDPIWCPPRATVHIDTAHLYSRPGRFIKVDGPVDESIRLFTQGEFDELLKTIYETGASPDLAFVSYDFAYERGIIGYWTWRWLKLRSALRLVGTRMRNAIFGAPSAPPTRGT